MATLSAGELTSYRQLTGDEAATVILADSVIQALYDRALTYELDATTTEAVTVVFILRRFLGLARVKVDIGNSEFEIERRSQYFKNLMDMLKYWEGIAVSGGFPGEGVGVMQVGTLGLGIDWTQADADALYESGLPS